MITRDHRLRCTPIHDLSGPLPRLMPVLALGALASLNACGAPADEVMDREQPAETESSALRSPVVFNPGHGCTGAQTTKIGAAVRRAFELSRRDDMLLCMQEHNLSGTRGYSPEGIMRRIREDTSTQAKCADVPDPSFGNAGASAPIGGPEVITFDRAYLDGSRFNPSELAGVVLHEVAHIKGWDHGRNGHLSDEYNFTVPEQLALCGVAIDSGAYIPDYGLGPVPNGNGAAHGESTRATILNFVGGGGGTALSLGCGTERFGRGVVGRAGSNINAVGLICSDRNGGGTGASGEVGGAGGNPYRLDCGVGNILTGIVGYADGLVSDVAPLCNTAANVRAFVGGGWSPGHATGSLRGDFYWRPCPNGMAVKSLYTRSGSVIDGFAVECERLSMGAAPAVSSLPAAGSATGTSYRMRCPVGSVMTGLTGRSGSAVDRLGGACRQVQQVTDPPSGTRWIRMTGSTDIDDGTHLDAQGGWGGTPWTTDACPSSMALIGLDIRAGSRIDRVRGVCADATKWSDERLTAGAVPIQGLTLHGGSGGTDRNVVCPRQYFLQGWDISADSLVNRIQPICFRSED